MDPALGVMSPFEHEAKGIDGMLDEAVEAITGPSPATMSHSNGSGNAAYGEHQPFDSMRANAGPSPSAPQLAGTLCSFCAQSSTTRRLPKDGLYVCQGCVAEQGSRPRVFPLGTFRCCPLSTEAVDGDVVRCAGCHQWYHVHCVGITDSVLRQFVTLSTTSWYCPEPACCDRVLQKHLKRQA